MKATSALPQATVQLQGLRLRYGTQTVLDGLDWQLLPGQVVGLLGRNGAGKTSLLESLLGLRDLQAGQVTLFGQPLAQLDDAARARIGYVPQQADLFDWLTAAEMLAYFRSFYPRWNEAKVDALLQRWDVAPHKPIGQLSGGQQQRLAIVRALAHEPDLLVLDEPVSGLDPAGRRDFLKELVEQVLDRGTTVVFSTHILSDLERVAFNVAFLQQGRIALQAPLDELIESSRYAIGPAAAVQAWLTIARHTGQRVHTLGEGQVRQLLRLNADDVSLPPPGVRLQPVTLEDLFMELA